MFSPAALFKKRITTHMKLLNRYLRYIFNGHFMLAILFLIITLSVYYQQWLENLSPNFPGAFVVALVLGVVASYNPLQMFLQEPDKVFLIVKEEKMSRYFRSTLFYNYFVQFYVVLLAAAAIMPMFSTVFPHKQTSDYVWIVLMVLVVKAWNMLANWWMLKIHNSAIRLYDRIIRTILSVALVYFLLVGELFIVTLVLYIFVIINNYWLSKKQSGLAWDILIENDQNRLAVFYRFVSMFANAPQVKKRMRKRQVITKLVNKFIPFEHKFTYDYLYRLTFFRSSDYFNMYIRLIILGSIVIIFISNSWLKVALALLFIYMTNFQMVTLFYHYRTSIWLDLYPISTSLQEKAFIKWLVQLTLVQTIIFSGLFLIWMDFTGLILTLVAGGLFNYLFNYKYVKKKIESSM